MVIIAESNYVNTLSSCEVVIWCVYFRDGGGTFARAVSSEMDVKIMSVCSFTWEVLSGFWGGYGSKKW